MSDGFDRLRRRGSAGAGHPPCDRLAGDRPPDPQGRRALFSVAEQPPAMGAVTVACARCGRTSVVTPRRLLGLALPSLHLPLLKRRHPSWMVCPACGRRTWVRLGLRL